MKRLSANSLSKGYEREGQAPVSGGGRGGPIPGWRGQELIKELAGANNTSATIQVNTQKYINCS